MKMICNRCGSPLNEVSKVVDKLENFLSPITTTKYKCSNDECQQKADQKLAEQEQAKLDRLAKKKA